MQVDVTKNAGYTIRLYAMYREQENGDNYIVLAENEKTGMWCTWECTNGTDFYWGHYFDSRIAAIRDYYRRLYEKHDTPWEV